MKLLSASAFLAALSVASVSSATFVNYDTVYPASMCKYAREQQADDFSSVKSAGTAVHLTVAHTMLCPMERFNPNSGAFQFAVVNVQGTGWSETACEMFITSWDGTTITAPPSPDYTEYSSTDRSQFVWGSWTVPNYSNLALTCFVPANKRIYKYELGEG